MMTYQEFQQRYKYNPNSKEDHLGEGGFGKVFKAYDTYRDRWVAIKIAPVQPQFESVRLRKEVELISKLPIHPNIAYYEECYTFSSFDGEYDFGILQYYDEGNLLQLIKKENLKTEQKYSILKQILSGLEFLHNNGIIHRDIKPQNILIVKRGTEYIPKITDFGISKKLDANKSTMFTNSLVGAGTLAYSSPEQLGERNIHKNTDLWSFGVIIYQVLKGKLPFTTGCHNTTSEAGRLELFSQINSGKLPEDIINIAEPWQSLIKACLISNADQRIKSGKECLNILEGNNESSEKTKLDLKEVNFVSDKTIFEIRVKQAEKTESKFSSTPKNIKTSHWIGIVFLIGILIISLILLTKSSEESKEYIIVEPFSNGYNIVQKKGLFGILDKNQKEVTTPIYDTIIPYSQWLAHVCKDSKWGYIDTLGNVVVSLSYPKEFTPPIALKGMWIQKKNTPFKGIYSSTSFSFENRAYIIGGLKGGREISEIWQYDPQKDEWKKMKDFPGGPRNGLFHFTISDKVYVGGGYYYEKEKDNTVKTGGFEVKYVDLWEYNPKDDSWVRKKDIPINHSLVDAVAFSIGNKGYVALGNPGGSITSYNDLWIFDQLSNEWSKGTEFPGKKRSDSFGFSLNGKGYIGGGNRYIYEEYNDFWEYDPNMNQWHQKGNLPGQKGHDFLTFTINDRFFKGLGCSWGKDNRRFSDFWEYESDIDEWFQKANFPGEKRDNYSFSFSVGNKAFVGGGVDWNLEKNKVFSDIWEFDPYIEGDPEQILKEIGNKNEK